MRTVKLFFLGVLLTGRGVFGANSPASASLHPAEGNYTQDGQRLIQGIQNLAENQKARGAEYKNVIRETINFGSSPNAADRFYSSSQKDLPGAAEAEWNKFIQDSFSILDEGERRDPKDPDWPKLREELSSLRPPPGADSKPASDKKNEKKDKQDKNKGQKKDKKQQKGSGKDKQEQPSGGGQKGEEQDGGEGQQGEGESEGPPSQGQPGKGNKKGGQQGGESEGSGEDGKEGKDEASRGRDPNQIREFDTSKQGEGQMKERGRSDEMKGMEDEKAGLGSLS